jgi:hypothetical protein
MHQHFIEFGEGKIDKRYQHIIWLATTWCLWHMRNNILFRGDCVNISSLVNQIVYTAWFWFIGRLRNNVDLAFSAWYNNPLFCLQSI